MPSKENYCYQILKTYSLIVDYEGTPKRKTVVKPKKGETFNRWKMRVLGNAVENVVLYIPTIPAQNTRISTLQENSDAEHIGKIFKAFEKKKNEKFTSTFKELKAVDKKRKVLLTAKYKKQLSNTERSYASYSKQILESLIQEHGGNMELPVQDFLKRFLDEAPDDINKEELLLGLLSKYNDVVRGYRELERKFSDCIPDIT